MVNELNKDIVRNGKHVFIVHSIKAQEIEDYITEASKQSGLPMDWFYIGGKAAVFAIGDKDKAIKVLEEVGKERFKDNHWAVYHRTNENGSYLPIDIDKPSLGYGSDIDE